MMCLDVQAMLWRVTIAPPPIVAEFASRETDVMKGHARPSVLQRVEVAEQRCYRYYCFLDLLSQSWDNHRQSFLCLFTYLLSEVGYPLWDLMRTTQDLG